MTLRLCVPVITLQVANKERKQKEYNHPLNAILKALGDIEFNDAAMVLPGDEIRISARELDDAPPDVKEYLSTLSAKRKRRESDKQVVPANLSSSNSNVDIERFLNDARDFVTRLGQSPTRCSGGEIPARSTSREEPASSARETDATSQITELLRLLERIKGHLQGKTKEPLAALTATLCNGNVTEIQQPNRVEMVSGSIGGKTAIDPTEDETFAEPPCLPIRNTVAQRASLNPSFPTSSPATQDASPTVSQPATASAPDPLPPTRITPPASGTEVVLTGSPVAPAGKNKRKPQRQDDRGSSYDKSDDEDGRSTSVRGSKKTPKVKKPKQHHASPQELADRVRSLEALRYFLSLVHNMRDPVGIFRHRVDTLERATHILSQATKQSVLTSFFTRLGQCMLAKHLDSTIEGYRHLTYGRKWNRVCGKYDGLLCLIVPPGEGGADPASYWDMTDNELADFHRRLKNPHVDQLRSAAKAFQNILGGAADVEFLWESASLTPDEIYNNGTLQDATFGTFPCIPRNLYQPDGSRRWARPKAWPSDWAWPVDPTKATGCDLCEARSCGCADEAFPKATPLIKRYEGKGLGLQAVAASPGQIAYRKGEWIGEITGELVPLNTYKDDKWVVELVRSDIEPPSAVCQVYCGRRGNCFRLLNHDCRPSALILPLKLSGRWMIGIQAKQDIFDGSEITIRYGRDFFGKGCCCQTCVGRRQAVLGRLRRSGA
ncbi:hypothetical protein QBC47DRAFT_36808 [Echria macrotheca]|uniref:SET domain-containing protein n=1 Tax=Echria macrotheca TaxID=438768 RepID=A0AAJ0F543_9PEZI|nr:hypothetical protein QBC47DRAFT_36808 [Echria macrotheca]